MRRSLVVTLMLLAGSSLSMGQDKILSSEQLSAFLVKAQRPLAQSVPPEAPPQSGVNEGGKPAETAKSTLALMMGLPEKQSSGVPPAAAGAPAPAAAGAPVAADTMTPQQKYDALVGKGIFAGAQTPPPQNQDMNREQFAKALAVLMGLSPAQDTAGLAKPQGNLLPNDLGEFIAGATSFSNLQEKLSPEVWSIIVLKMLGVTAGSQINPQMHAQILAALSAGGPQQRNAALINSIGGAAANQGLLVDQKKQDMPAGPGSVDQKKQDMLAQFVKLRTDEEKRQEQELAKVIETAQLRQTLARAEQTKGKQASIWPAWVGAIPSYSAAYSEVVPSLLAGYRAEYNGEARGTDAEGRPLEGALTIQFSAGGADSVNMVGALMGLEFGANLAHVSNRFAANLDPGSVDLSKGTETYYVGGRIEGKFYGSSHENVGGTFSLTGDTTSNVSGHFAGVGN